MRFTRVPPTKAEGALLAHGLRAGGARFEKGRRLTAADIETMRAAGVDDIAVAFLAADDLPENDAAARVAGALCGDNLRAGKALSGRVNLFATARGVLSFDAAALTRLNLIDPAIAVAAAAPCRRVEEGEMTATIKIIPFAVARAVVEEAAIAGARLRVAPYQMRDAVLLQTTIDSTKESVLAKTRRVTEARLAAVGIEIVREIRLPHRREAIAAALHDLRPAAPDLILLAGAVAVGDENDEAPAGIRDGGGAIERVGMPVDPGNLLVLGRLENAVCVVLPGCAKSPQAGGFDLLLPRLAAGVAGVGRRCGGVGRGRVVARDCRSPAAAARARRGDNRRGYFGGGFVESFRRREQTACRFSRPPARRMVRERRRPRARGGRFRGRGRRRRARRRSDRGAIRPRGRARYSKRRLPQRTRLVARLRLARARRRMRRGVDFARRYAARGGGGYRKNRRRFRRRRRTRHCDSNLSRQARQSGYARSPPF